MKIAGSNPIARRAEKKELQAKVAIFDYFNEEEGVRHGDRVESILLRSGLLKDEDVQNYLNTYDRNDEDSVTNASPDKVMEELETYTEQTVAGFLQATTMNLQSILEDENSQVRVVNQSQSQAPARVARPFVNKVLTNERFRVNIKEALGINMKAHRDTVAMALLDQVQRMFANNPSIARAKNQYEKTAKQAFDKGIVHVVTSGNLGRVADEWSKLGITAPEGSFRSLLANEYTTIVGATDSRGTTSIRDDRAASFTSIDAGAEFAMHGTHVNVPSYKDESKDYSNGTSYAAPQLSSVIHEMLQANPALTVPEIEDLLAKSCVPVAGGPEQVGAGQVDPERALFLADQTAHIAKNKDLA